MSEGCSPAQGAEEDEPALVDRGFVGGASGGCVLRGCELGQAPHAILDALHTGAQ